MTTLHARHCAPRLLLAFTVALASAPLAPLRSQAPPPQNVPLAAGTTAIIVDVIVRDKRGNPVTDLAPGDFELLEDGVAQDVSSFKRVSRGIGFALVRKDGDTPTSSFSQPETVADPNAGTGVLALVFDRLSPEARSIAHKAATSYMNGNVLPGDRVGVFAIDLALRRIQGYTTAAAAVHLALARWATRGTTQAVSSSGRLKELRARQAKTQAEVQAAQEIAAATSRADPAQGRVAAATMGGASIEELFADMEIRTLKTFNTLERDQLGYATTDALLAVISSLRLLPGRKTMVFFSEGMAIPPAVQHRFRHVIDTANRANVAIYPMDASGLRIESTLEETRREVNAAADERLQHASTGLDVTDSLMKVLERNEDSLKLNPHSGLGQLASETGGFLIRNTNDLAAGFRRIDEDMRFHYLLTYAPKNQEFDGRFRQIALKVHRPGLEVRSRKGYYAVRETGPSPVLTYEAPAMALLDAPTVPNAFPIRTGALQFIQPDGTSLVPVLAEVNTERLTFHEDPEKQRYATDFTILVRIKDDKDQIVEKMSQQYELGGPLDQLPLAKHGEVVFQRAPQLAPGLYVMETIVYDALARKASARISTIEVPKANANGPRMSSLVIVKRSEKASREERENANPLYYGDLLLYPNLGQPLKRSINKELSFLVAIYPQSKEQPTAIIELLKDGTSAGRVAVELPKPDAVGRIQHVGRIPIEGFPPAAYELRMIVTDGTGDQARTATFRVE